MDEQTQQAADPRERSTIRFPYGDLEDAITLVETIDRRFGRSCTLDQLAAGMGQSVSGAFRNKVATAATFGVIETGRGTVTLTDLGSRLVDPQTNSAARAEAFLAVPLYEKVYDNFRGSRLPGDAGFEAELVRFGVSPKVSSKARQAFQRSAEQAGFFSLGRDRLVQPPAATLAEVLSTDTESSATELSGHADAASSARGDLTVTRQQHPLILGLFQMLPQPSLGAFTPAQQKDWLDAAKVNLRLLYGGDDSTAGVASTYAETSGSQTGGSDREI